MAKIVHPAQEKKIQEIRTRKYLATIHLLPDLRQKRNKEYLQVIFTFIALIIAGVFAINPTLTTIADLSKQVNDAKQIDNQLVNKISSLSQLNIEYNALQSTLPLINNAVPTIDDAQNLLAEIQGAVQLHNLRLTTLATTPVTTLTDASGDIYVLNVQISAVGQYQDERDFLNEIIMMQRILVPTSVLISKPTQTANGAAAGPNGLLLTLSGNAYYIK